MKKKQLIVAIAVIFIAVSYILGIKYSERMIETLSYNEFIKMVDNGEVKTINYNKGSSTIDVIGDNGKITHVTNPESSTFKEEMLKKDIKINEKTDNKNIYIELLSISLRVGVMIFLLKMLTKSSGSSLISNKSMFEKKKSSIRFNDIAGNQETKKDMELLVNFLKNPKKYNDMGATLPKGALLYGPPGTGKTLTAKAIAGEAGVPFFAASGSDFIELYAGMGAKKVRGLFDAAKRNAPCIVFIDEIDSLASKRGINDSSEKDQTINALLSEMDGFEGSEGIIVMGATNRLDILDPAVLRPGRFDRHIAVELPDLRERKMILDLHFKNKNISPDVAKEDIAKMTIGFSGASLSALVNEATINAANNNRDIVINKDIDEAYIKMITKGHIKENNDRTKEDTELVAYHEAGHALISKLITDNSTPKVTITPTTSGAGGFTVTIPEKLGLLTKEEIKNQIIVLYGGRAAEEILRKDKNKITTGASNDIKVATNHIKSYFEIYGMSEEYGMLDLTQYENDSMQDSVKLSKELYGEAIKMLTENEDKLKAIAEELIEKETLSEEELDNLIIK